MIYAGWYDNGTRYYEGAELVEADSPQEAWINVKKNGLGWCDDVVVTQSWEDDPNMGGEVLCSYAK